MVTVSIVTYKHELKDIIHTIQCVLECNSVSGLIIVDNSPTDKLKYDLDKTKIDYFFNKYNLGYGAAHNVAIKKSIESNIRYHLVLNPDVRFQSGTLEKLIEFMENNPDVGNVMPKVLYPDGSTQYLCKLLPTPYDWIGRRFNLFRKILNKRNELFELRFTDYNEAMDVPYLSGCFMFLRVEALEKIGLFDKNIFMYGEETDLCRRLIAGGYRTVFYPEAEITHEFQKGSHKSFRFTWIGIKSAIYYFNKWGWFFDKVRREINKKTLDSLGYIK